MCTPGSASDVDAIMAIMDRAFPREFGEAWSAAQCLSALAMPGCELLLARNDEAVAGFAIARTVAGESELLLLAVDPLMHRQGVGSALVGAICENVAANGAHSLFVEVRTDNPARLFYERHGFSAVGSRANYYRRTDGGDSSAITLQRKVEKV